MNHLIKQLVTGASGPAFHDTCGIDAIALPGSSSYQHIRFLQQSLCHTHSYDGLLMFTAFVAIKCAWLGELPGSTSYFG
jgi:hypothetical protein